MKKIGILVFVIIVFTIFNCPAKEKNKVEVSKNLSRSCVDVIVNGKLFTSYIFSDSIPVLKKPVLFPIVAASGVTITRGFPLQPRSGERIDHPHHIGAWFNYGDVNGLDFWNNSDAIPKEKENLMGTILNERIIKTQSGKGKGKLVTASNWVNSKKELILKEKTALTFYAKKSIRIIDRVTDLTAPGKPVLFKDNKEGVFGMRMARELELPSKQPVELSDANGNKTQVPVMDNTGVTGNYLNSEGITGPDVWAKRARWVALSGNIKGNDVTVVIFDNPKNAGFPTYWHARDYGLFAANPLGQNIFSNGKETLNFSLDANKSVTFNHRILIYDGRADKTMIEKEYGKFVKGIF